MSQANFQHNNFHKKPVEQTKPVESMLGKSLPSNIDAERAILGAILLHDECYHSIADILLATDFYMPAHKAIYQAIVTLASSNQRIDMITLQHQLELQKEMDVAGGVIYLVGLQEDIPSVGLIEQHAKIVKSKSTLRSLINSSVNIITDCYNQSDKDIESIIDDAERRIFDVSSRTTNKDFIQLDIWLRKTFQHLSSIKSSSQGVTGVSSCFESLDEKTSGFQKGDLIILAARPSMGKTAFALNLSINASKNKMAVGFFSLEMSAEQLTLRLLATESGINHHKIRNATISSEEWIELTHVAADLAQMKFFIDDTAGISIMELRAKARKLKAKHGIDMLVVDYLQLLHSNKKHENRHQEVSEISRALKSLAKELEVPIIALSQLSRAVDSRVDKRPLLSDLRESGAIEQDADVIMFMYRDIVYNPETENPAAAELIIGKQRNGPTGTVNLQFIRELTKFESAPQEY